MGAPKRPKLQRSLTADGTEFYYYRKPSTRDTKSTPKNEKTKPRPPVRVRKSKLG